MLENWGNTDVFFWYQEKDFHSHHFLPPFLGPCCPPCRNSQGSNCCSQPCSRKCVAPSRDVSCRSPGNFLGANKSLRKILSKLNHFITGEIKTSGVQLLSTTKPLEITMKLAVFSQENHGNEQKKTERWCLGLFLRLKAANFKTHDFFVAIEFYKGLVLDDGGWRHGDWHFDDLAVMNTLYKN